MEDMLVFHPGPGLCRHQGKPFTAVVTYIISRKQSKRNNQKKGSPTYPTTSNIIKNDVHLTSSPMLNRPLAMRSLPIEFAYPSSLVEPIPDKLLAPKLKGPVPVPIAVKANVSGISKSA